MSVLTAAAVVTPDSVLRPGWVRTDGRPPGGRRGGRPARRDRPRARRRRRRGGVRRPALPRRRRCVVRRGRRGVVDRCRGRTWRTARPACSRRSSPGRRRGCGARSTALAGARRRRRPGRRPPRGPVAVAARSAARTTRRCSACPTRTRSTRSSASPAVRMVTLAPELPGAIEAVRRIAGLGAVAAIGHTDADLATTRAAIAAGAPTRRTCSTRCARCGTAIPARSWRCSRTRRCRSRSSATACTSTRTLCAWLDATIPADRLVAVTDAMAAAAGADGRYLLGDLDVVVDGRGGPGARHDDHRGQHRDHGPALPLSPRGARPTDAGTRARSPADGDEPGARDRVSTTAGASSPARVPTSWCSTPDALDGPARHARGPVGHDSVNPAAGP